MPRSSAPKLTQGAVMAILVAATVAALMWLAQAPGPGRGTRGPDLPAPPAPPALETPDPRPAPGVPAVPAPPLPDAANPSAADPDLADTEPAGPAPPESVPPTRTTPWRVIDADAYSLTPATVPLHARLPGAYDWPLPDVDRLELICFHEPDGPAHPSVMQTADGRLFHWGEERRFLQEHLRADGIDSREIRTIADPGAFMEPLRAAAHAACVRSLRGADTTDGPGRPRQTAPKAQTSGRRPTSPAGRPPAHQAPGRRAGRHGPPPPGNGEAPKESGRAAASVAPRRAAAAPGRPRSRPARSGHFAGRNG